MKRCIGILVIVAFTTFTPATVVGEELTLSPVYCGNLQMVNDGEITIDQAMKSCMPNIYPDKLYGWISAEMTYNLLRNQTMPYEWVILDVRKRTEYEGTVPDIYNQGHPIWLRKWNFSGIGLGNYEHPYLNSWFTITKPTKVPNPLFWERMLELQSEGKIQKDRTVLITMCQTGTRGHAAANFLALQGYSVFNMGTSFGVGTAGFSEWYYGELPPTCTSGDSDCTIAPQYSGYNPND